MEHLTQPLNKHIQLLRFFNDCGKNGLTIETREKWGLEVSNEFSK
jgi:hypothetical protein